MKNIVKLLEASMAGTQLEKAKTIAMLVHANQYRRDGITPYIKHVMDVADRVNSEDDWTQAVAWLHDVLEDSTLTANDLEEAGIERSIIKSVNLLTVYSSDSYMVKISFVKDDIMARKVKIADILSNLSDSPTDKQIMKYAGALQILLSKHAN